MDIQIEFRKVFLKTDLGLTSLPGSTEDPKKLRPRPTQQLCLLIILTDENCWGFLPRHELRNGSALWGLGREQGQRFWESRELPTSQAPRLQDQPVLGDHLYVLATQRLPQPHLHLQLAPSGLPSIQDLRIAEREMVTDGDRLEQAAPYAHR